MLGDFKEMWYEKDYVSFFGFAVLFLLNTVLVVVFAIALLCQALV